MPTCLRRWRAIVRRMKRRSWLKLGLGSALLLGLGGGWLATREAGWLGDRFSPSATTVLRNLARGFLAGTLPTDAAAQDAALNGLLQRLANAVSALPVHAQQELSQLLALLATVPGRAGLAGVTAPWDDASVTELQAGLHAMRFSQISLRQQAYQALHDLTGAAYFSSPDTWTVLAYPGPRDI